MRTHYQGFVQGVAKPLLRASIPMLVLALTISSAFSQDDRFRFRRVATLPVVSNTCFGLSDAALEQCTAKETSAEIVAASEDGRLLVYTDALTKNIGFVDITNPDQPQPAGVLDIQGDPTSVAIAGNFALVAVNTGSDFQNPTGKLAIVNLTTRAIVRTVQLNGQPDSVVVSPDRKYAAIAIENERNEEFCVGFPAVNDEDDCEAAGGSWGTPSQSPAGFLVRVVLTNPVDPATWTANPISLTGIPDKFPDDPEPEFIDINSENIAVVTLQENNYIVMVNLASGSGVVTTHFSAGSTNLSAIDSEDNGIIELNSSLTNVLREPDGVSWIDNDMFVTADEGDLDGGSRGFTIFHKSGAVLYRSGSLMDHIAARIGHYPEGRSENKGNESEGVEVAQYPMSGQRYIFVGSERSSFVGVFAMSQRLPVFMQALPASAGPEGLLAIPGRNLLVSTGEEDVRGPFRASITIYRLEEGAATYPDVQSNDVNGLPVTWAALSGLSADPQDPRIVYSISDSAFSQAFLYTMDITSSPAKIIGKAVVTQNGAPAKDLDLEGIAARANGGYWLASEGDGGVDEPSRPVRTRNQLIQVDNAGRIERIVELPASVNAMQRRFGFEGVAVEGAGDSEVLYVAFQREWVGDPANHARIGRYNVRNQEWTFAYYQKATPSSPNGGWTGLSDIAFAGANTLVVVERDNQGGPDARIKELRSFRLSDVIFRPQGETLDVITRAEQTLVRDLVPDLLATNGYVIEKVEGLAITKQGDVIVNTDNDGVDDHSGETRQVKLGRLF